MNRTNNECFVSPDYRLLNTKCKTECKRYVTEYLVNVIDTYIRSGYGKNYIVIEIPYKTKINMIWNLCPKIDFITYLSTIGGLMGMWMGFSVHSILYVIMVKIHKTIKPYKISSKYF